jgi:hypothetical protein
MLKIERPPRLTIFGRFRLLYVPAKGRPGSASIPEASIPYRYRIELVSIARIDTESI